MDTNRHPYFRLSLWAHALGACVAVFVLGAIIVVPHNIVPMHVFTGTIGVLLVVRFLAEWGYKQRLRSAPPTSGTPTSDGSKRSELMAVNSDALTSN